jgi:uncharacterized phage protein (TIGR02218 family)
MVGRHDHLAFEARLMRSASTALQAALAARLPLWSADLFDITLANAVTYYYTSADQDIHCDGNIYAARGPTIDRTAWGSKQTTEVPEMTVQIYSTGTDFADGLTNLKSDAINGLFDGAYLLLKRVFMPEFGNVSLGSVVVFGGRFGAIEVNGLGIKVTCSASTVMLTQELPRRTYEATCMHTLYDVGCTLDGSTNTDYYTVASANRTSIAWVGAGPGVRGPRYLYGTTSVISGAGAGQQLTVMNVSSFGVAFAYPLLTIPNPGDAFSCQYGCAKTIAACQQFGNILNYGGFPYIPSVSQGF